jgi:hypothetical protein
MIIKRKRVKAGGQALSRALKHVMDGEDNGSVVLVAGAVADLEDARADAIRFEYAVRHWILTPGEEISDEQLADAIARLAAEFGFDPERAVIWKHTKSRATADGCSQHFHVMAPEVDPSRAALCPALTTTHVMKKFREALSWPGATGSRRGSRRGCSRPGRRRRCGKGAAPDAARRPPAEFR